MIHHIKNIKKYGVFPVVAINRFALFPSFHAPFHGSLYGSFLVGRFSTDTEAELELVRTLSLEAGAFDARVANHWAKGGAGATDLGEAVIAACAAAKAAGSPFK